MSARWFALCIALLFVIKTNGKQACASDDDFEASVRPLLVEKCQGCHGVKEQNGGLKLTHRDEILSGGDNGPAIVPGEPEKSLLIQAIGYQGELKMPPDGKLSETQIATLVQWVKNGAVWPDEIPGTTAGSKNATSVLHRELWSLKPVRDVSPPEVRNRNWPNTSIDHFLLTAMEQNGLAPSQPADKQTLIRRATFDLTGLPPTPEEVAQFLKDPSPTAYANVVERLLASPLYGERWGRHWLDVVRYADARDLIQLPAESDFREAWRYRDWVVKAFNSDLPYDQFVRQQIAGDLLQPSDDSQIDVDGLVATGMLALADFVPGDVDKDQMIADYVNDQIDVVGRAFLGLTVACARCHDHKFDPISTEDYYALAGIFFSSRLIPGPVAGNTPLVRAPLLPAQKLREIEAEAERDKNRIAHLIPRVQTATDRVFFTQMQRQLGDSIARVLPTAIEYYHRSQVPNPPPLESFAKESGVDAGELTRWQAFLKQNQSRPILAPLLRASTNFDEQKNETTAAAAKLANELTSVANSRRDLIATDAVARSLADSETVRLRSDDSYIETDDNQCVKRWPSRTLIAEDAAPDEKSSGPKLDSVDLPGCSQRVMRYDGKVALRLPQAMPPAGTFVAFFRPASNASGTRLVGWEDAAVGQHGVGLMMREGGGLHAIIRRNGASGDIVSGDGNLDWQLATLTWGAGGTTLYRNGILAGSNAAIDSASADPAITALQIGGPGSSQGLRFVGDLAEIRVYSKVLDEPARLRVEDDIRSHWMVSRDEGVATGLREEVRDLFSELLSSRGPYWVASDKRWESLPPAMREQLSLERLELEQLKSKPAVEIPRTITVLDGGPPGTRHEGFHDAPVFIRGNPKRLGKVVPRGIPAAFGGEPVAIEKGSGRLELAQWLTRADHPLTARVIVNRTWQHHFGQGLVRTSTNFGVRGELPSHPELLDYLAKRLVESGWSIKDLHREILLSSTYQQSSLSPSSRDPENRFLSRMPRRRLDAEEIRDSLLATSGVLSSNSGGPGFLDVAVSRRTLYLMSVRTGAKAADFASLFDGSSGGGIIERRNQSTVAPQALFFMNDAWLDQAATALADRGLREASDGTSANRIRKLYEILFARPATDREIEIGLQLIDDNTVANPWVRYCRVLFCSNEFIHVD